jgi:hypothetical protein
MADVEGVLHPLRWRVSEDFECTRTGCDGRLNLLLACAFVGILRFWVGVMVS